VCGLFDAEPIPLSSRRTRQDDLKETNDEDSVHHCEESAGTDVYNLWLKRVPQLHPSAAPAKSAGDSISHRGELVALRRVLFAVQLLGGLLLLSGYFVPLALTLLAAELYNILSFHLTLAPASIPPALLASVLWILVFLQYRASFKDVLAAKSAPGTTSR
jgi:hypothetical protein